MASVQNEISRGVSSGSTPQRDLNHCRSRSTMVSTTIGTSNSSFARWVSRSNDASAGVSRIAYAVTAARRCSSSASIVATLGGQTIPISDSDTCRVVISKLLSEFLSFVRPSPTETRRSPVDDLCHLQARVHSPRIRFQRRWEDAALAHLLTALPRRRSRRLAERQLPQRHPKQR